MPKVSDDTLDLILERVDDALDAIRIQSQAMVMGRAFEWNGLLS